jgi:hypothetical protein
LGGEGKEDIDKEYQNRKIEILNIKKIGYQISRIKDIRISYYHL